MRALFLRLTAFLLITLFILVGLIEILSRAATPESTCLSVNQTYVVDPQTGSQVVRKPPTQEAALSVGEPSPYSYSPDGKKTAYVEAPTDGSSRPIVRVGRDDAAENGFYGNVDLSLTWSPNSQWIVQYWQNNDSSSHVTLLDDNAAEIGDIPLGNMGLSPDHSLEWSADSKYLMLMLDAESGTSHEIRIMSIPDLKQVDLGENGKNALDSFQFQWSKHGHQAAYIAYQDNRLSLVMLNPDHHFQQVFSLFENVKDYGAVNYVQDLELSPDGQSVALALVTKDNPYPEGDKPLTIYTLDGNIYPVGNVTQLSTSDWYYVTEMAWLPEGNSLVYIHSLDSDGNYAEVEAYHLTTKTSEVLVPQADYGYDLLPSPVGQSVVLTSGSCCNEAAAFVYLITLDNSQAYKLDAGNVPFSHMPTYEVEWTPDGNYVALLPSPYEVHIVNHYGHEVWNLVQPYMPGTFLVPGGVGWTACR